MNDQDFHQLMQDKDLVESAFYCGCSATEERASAVRKLTFLCPRNFTVSDVQARQSNKKTYCRWDVTYEKADDPRIDSVSKGMLKDIIECLKLRRPSNWTVLNLEVDKDENTVVIKYGVKGCNCSSA